MFEDELRDELDKIKAAPFHLRTLEAELILNIRLLQAMHHRLMRSVFGGVDEITAEQITDVNSDADYLKATNDSVYDTLTQMLQSAKEYKRKVLDVNIKKDSKLPKLDFLRDIDTSL